MRKPNKQQPKSEDPDYTDATPPGEHTEVDLSQMPDVKLQGHLWRQQGRRLICYSCPYQHSTALPRNQNLYGINKDGTLQIH